MNITVNGYELSPSVISDITKGSYKNERLNFVFDDSWNGLVKTVTFYTPKREVVCLVTEEGMPIPDEVINTVGVTRYMICGTDGKRTVVSATGAINIKSSLSVDLGSFEGRSPGVVEQITTYLKHSVDAYEDAYGVASDVASYATAAQNAKNEAQNAKSAAEQAQLMAQEMSSSAASSADKCKTMAEKVGKSNENLGLFMKNHKLPLVLYGGSYSGNPEPGVMYFKKKADSGIQNRYSKSVFLCEEGDLYYAWKCDELTVYTLSESPAASDAVYIKDSYYTVEQGGTVTLAGDGVIRVLIGDATYVCYRMSALDTQIGVYGWERIMEANPARRIKTFDIGTESIKAIATEDEYGNSFLLNEFFLRFTLVKSPNATLQTSMSVLVNNYEIGAIIPYSSESEKVYIFHGVCLGDGVLVRRVPMDTYDLGNISCNIKPMNCPITSLGVHSSAENKIGAGSKVEIWGVDY